MLLKLEKLIAKYGMKITGVIQAGAHEGEELELFKRLRITKGYFFEPCNAYWLLAANVTLSEGDFMSFKCGLSCYNGSTKIFTTKFNKGQSNSLLKPKRHLHHYPEIEFDELETVALNRLDAFYIDD